MDDDLTRRGSMKESGRAQLRLPEGAYDVPFMIEHRQRVCKLSFERMVEPPSLLYGESIGSAYQRQVDTLSKHFKQPTEPEAGPASLRPKPSEHPVLFDEPNP